MAITQRNPRTIHLAGPITVVDDADHKASAAITPGHLVELHDNTTLDYRKNASATEMAAVAVALERNELNKTIDDDYASGDVVKVGYLQNGSVFYGLVASGQTITYAALYQSNADGTLKAATATTQAAGLGKFQSLDDTGAVIVLTRVRFMVIAG